MGKKRINILSIDGGGIRGVIPSTLLEAIEEYFIRENNPKKIHEIFHTIGGTSTGGIISVMLSVPKTSEHAKNRGEIMSAAEITNFYKDHGREIFPKSIMNLRRSILLFILFATMAYILGSYLLRKVLTEPEYLKINFTNILLRLLTESSEFTIALSTLTPSVFMASTSIVYKKYLRTVGIPGKLLRILEFFRDMTYKIRDTIFAILRNIFPESYIYNIIALVLCMVFALESSLEMADLLKEAILENTTIREIAEKTVPKPILEEPRLYMLFCIQLFGAFFFFNCVVRYHLWPKFYPKQLENAFGRLFDSNTTLANAKTNVGVLSTDTTYSTPFVFNSVRAQMYSGEDRKGPKDIMHAGSLLKIVRSTSAAPTYFPSVEFENENVQVDNTGVSPSSLALDGSNAYSVDWCSLEKPEYGWKAISHEDGGVTQNNPSKEVLDVCKMALIANGEDPHKYEILILSLSTGVEHKQRSDKPAVPTGGLVGVVYNRLLNFGKEISVKAHNVHLRMSHKYMAQNQSDLYFRPEFKITEAQLEGMDNSSEENVESLIRAAHDWIYKNPEDLEKIRGRKSSSEESQNFILKGDDEIYTEDFLKLVNELKKVLEVSETTSPTTNSSSSE